MLVGRSTVTTNCTVSPAFTTALSILTSASPWASATLGTTKLLISSSAITPDNRRNMPVASLDRPCLQTYSSDFTSVFGGPLICPHRVSRRFERQSNAARGQRENADLPPPCFPPL